MGAVTGLGVGVLQALVLARSRVSGALWWAVANPPAWALGWLVTSYVITRNVKDQFTNFGASGAIVFGLLTWLLLAMLFREREPKAPR
jgi:CHASE2 domain-containing sensor protein